MSQYPMAGEIKVLVVDDSAVVRQVLSDILGREPGIRVIGVASDPLFALARMHKEWPDVITLDVEMPRMDGLTFLRKIMAERPTPVVICSSLARAGAETTIQALAAGAVSVIAKPTIGVRDFLSESSNDVVAAVRAAAASRVGNLATRPLPRLTNTLGREPTGRPVRPKATGLIVAIGASTGGTQALETVLTTLPVASPAIVIVQHMPEKFTAAFAERLNGLCEIDVSEAQDGQQVLPGCALIAPGGRHMSLRQGGAQYYVEVTNGPVVNRHRPSVDVLFRSVAKHAGRNALGIIMTGMGDDGARGLKEMHDAGAYTIAQDEETCVVYGMPKEAARLGAVDRIVPLQQIAAAIV